MVDKQTFISMTLADGLNLFDRIEGDHGNPLPVTFDDWLLGCRETYQQPECPELYDEDALWWLHAAYWERRKESV
jgi:hypothetical protein